MKTEIVLGEHVAKSRLPQWKVWKSIMLGTGLEDAFDFRAALEAEEYTIGPRANDIIGIPVFTVSKRKKVLKLVTVSVYELGFKGGAFRQKIYSRAQTSGLRLCPAEVGPQLRLQYSEQPRRESLVIGMKPVVCSDGRLSVFFVDHRVMDNSNGVGQTALCLNAYDSSDDRLWGPGHQYVFVSSEQ